MADNGKSYTDELLHLTTAEAVALVKRAERIKGTRFYAHLRFDAPVVGKPGHVFPHGCHGSVELSKSDALRLASSMLSEALEERGGRIAINKHTSSSGTISYVSYWFT